MLSDANKIDCTRIRFDLINMFIPDVDDWHIIRTPCHMLSVKLHISYTEECGGFANRLHLFYSVCPVTGIKYYIILHIYMNSFYILIFRLF